MDLSTDNSVFYQGLHDMKVALAPHNYIWMIKKSPKKNVFRMLLELLKSDKINEI